MLIPAVLFRDDGRACQPIELSLDVAVMAKSGDPESAESGVALSILNEDGTRQVVFAFRSVSVVTTSRP